MICAGNTRHFKENMILDLFPKILTTLSVLLMNEKRHASIRILKIFLHVHYLYLTFLAEYKPLTEEIDKQISEFNKDEAKRHKDVIPSLGAFQTNFLVKWERLDDSLKAIQQEQLDRQVFWLLKNIPELKDQNEEISEERAMITFKSQQTSYQILLFWVMMSRFFSTNFKTVENLLKVYETNLGRLTDKLENEIQANCKKILEVATYEEFFSFIGKENVTQSELNKRLKNAIGNSKRRKYHGTDDEILTLPPSGEQIKAIEEKYHNLLHYVNLEQKKLKDLPEDEWKKNTTTRWIWIKELLDNDPKLSPKEIANISDKEWDDPNKKHTDSIVEVKNKYLQDMS